MRFTALITRAAVRAWHARLAGDRGFERLHDKIGSLLETTRA
jgi:hypothetical protein